MLFADDDTSVFYSNPDLNCAISAVNNDLGQIDLFMKANKLSVNITKLILSFSQQDRDRWASQ